MKAELWMYLQDADQQLQNMKRRGAELELNIAQNMVLQVKVRSNVLLSEIKVFIQYSFPFCAFGSYLKQVCLKGSLMLLTGAYFQESTPCIGALVTLYAIY